MKWVLPGRARLLWRTFLVAVLLAIAQDVVLTIMAHAQFAGSVVCLDPATRAAAGRYADIHCRAHTELGDYRALSAYLHALGEQQWGRVGTVVAAVVWAGV